MSYKLLFASDFEKEISKYDKAIKIQIFKKINQLLGNPDLGKPLSNILKNSRSLHINKYRVIYRVVSNTIIVFKVSHRKYAYET